MKKGKSLLRWSFIAVILTVVSSIGFDAYGVAEAPSISATERADVLMIDTLKAYGELEEPPVVFLHDAHTDALAKQNRSCDSCHESENGKLVIKFKRLKDTDAATDKDIYHKECITCHKETAAAGIKSGPAEESCRSCHQKTPTVVSSKQDVGMDKSLHFRHVASKAIPATGGEEANCASCHHEYDEQTQKTLYKKGEESTCRYCHEAEPTKDVRSMSQASHTACVSCHVELAAKQTKDNGPTTCAGCHSAQAQATFKVVQEVPRLERNQPDQLFVSAPAPKAGAQGKPGMMKLVAFDHKGHEEFTDNCRDCHVDSLKSPVAGFLNPDGKSKTTMVDLDTAMHDPTSQASCVGCHNIQKKSKDCAGCHDMMPKERPSEASCVTCHETDKPEGFEMMTKEQQAEAAAVVVAARKPYAGTYAIEDIPETVVIDDLADKFQASEFPHRKVVLALYDRVKGNDLAGAFHTEQGTLCQGCHHNSPTSKTPPKCASCHSKPFQAENTSKPGLKAAFHRQCIGCHQSMEIEKPAATACVECHKESKK